ncbi:MAG: hypothetical protein HXS53_04140 [Theionarchaea archaeon]|nr:hypothetical protein [Theionarchaea archaeon]
MHEVTEHKDYPCPEKEGAFIHEKIFADGTREVKVSGDCWGCDYLSVWMKCTKYEKKVYE